MNTPMSAAIMRAIAIAVLTVFVSGFTTYVNTNNVKASILVAAAAAITVLGGRGVVEGSIDSVRAVKAANGDLSAISTADVGATSPAIPPKSK